jgi:hypothetical protein
MSLLVLRRAAPSHCRRAALSTTAAAAAAPLPLHQQQPQQQAQAHQQQAQQRAAFPSAFLQAALNGVGASAGGGAVPGDPSSATAPATAAPPPPPPAGAGAAAAAGPSRPYPAHLIDGREEEEIGKWCTKTPQPVSLRTLVQVGLGRRPFLSSLRDACSLRDALNSLNSRLQISANDISPEEVTVCGLTSDLSVE